MYIRLADPNDVPGLSEIYNHYVRNSIATFELVEVPLAVLTERLLRVLETLPWMVAEIEGELAGYACASPWRGRPAYRNSVETTIYLNPEFTGRGLGRRLYAALIERLTAAGLRTLIGGIALPNPSSIRMHESLGFRKVAHFEQVGFKFDRWIDVGYWQLLLADP